MSLPPSSSLLAGSSIEIPQDRYKADLEMLDRYIGFSAEIGRLSLACLGAIGFTVGLLTEKGKLPLIVKSPLFLWPTIASLTFLAVALALALGHRYYASNGIYYHLRAIKHLILVKESIGAVASDAEKKAFCDENERNNNFRRSAKYLFFAAILLGMGVVTAGASFIVLIYSST